MRYGAAAGRWPQLTLGLIVASVVVAMGTQLGAARGAIYPLLLAMPEVRAGELWRLITPIFLHFGVLHIVFNMLWLWDLGGSVELRQGWWWLGLLVVLFAIPSNVAEYYFSGPFFGGMSGVVYGLLGYVWMQGHFNPRSGLFLHKEIVAMMLIWYLLGWTGLIGAIANMAHTMGLVLGVVVGYGTAQSARLGR